MGRDFGLALIGRRGPKGQVGGGVGGPLSKGGRGAKHGASKACKGSNHRKRGWVGQPMSTTASNPRSMQSQRMHSLWLRKPRIPPASRQNPKSRGLRPKGRSSPNASRFRPGYCLCCIHSCHHCHPLPLRSVGVQKLDHGNKEVLALAMPSTEALEAVLSSSSFHCGV